VGDGAIFFRRCADVKEAQQRSQIGFAGGGEVPVLEGFVCVLAGVGAAVAAQHLWRVVFGIEADAEQAGLLV